MSEFQFPPFYSLPPFFTIQTNVDSRSKQFEIWCQLLTDYCKHKKIFQLPVKDGVFGNDQVNRRLSPAEIQQVGDYVYQQSLGMWQDDSKSVLIVFHKKDSEWAAEIYKWASDMQRLNSVETIFSIYQGEETVGQSFHGIDVDVVYAALAVLERQGKAEIFRGATTQSDGVKFFGV